MRLIDADYLRKEIDKIGVGGMPVTVSKDYIQNIITNAPTVQQSEPFGYFKAEPFGWTDCAETDEGAIALYEAPTVQREGWISVDDRLPEIETDVLVCGIRFNSWYTTVAGLFYGEWLSQETEKKTLFDITHWQPLPAAPTDKE